MAQHDMNIANQGFPAFRSDLNNALSALVTNSSGATAPSTTFAHQFWVDTSANPSVLKIRNADNDAWISVAEFNQTTDLLTKIYGLVIGTDIAGLATDQTFTGSQRGAVTTDNDGSFDMSASNNFKCTPTGNFTLTFTNITAGQSGFVLLVNGSNYTVSAAATTKVSASALSTISATGTYLLSYFSDGTNVFVVNSGALS